MNSKEIFDYSEDFLNEIIDELLNLKRQKLSNPKNKDFDQNFDQKKFKKACQK